MPYAQRLYVIVVVGFRNKEFLRLSAKAEGASFPVILKNGGHISGGSNSEREAKTVAQTADLVLGSPAGRAISPEA